MASSKNSRKKSSVTSKHRVRKSSARMPAILGLAVVLAAIVFFFFSRNKTDVPSVAQSSSRPVMGSVNDLEKHPWLQRAQLVGQLFHAVYTPGWEGAYGAIGDAYLFAATNDSALLRFHLIEHPLTSLSNGTWLDDRAWACLAELYWWEVTGRANMVLVADAAQRYREAREAGMLSHHEGYWAWYKYPPQSNVGEEIFTNSNMNQMVNVACRLYDATGEMQFLDDALLVWNGDNTTPGIEKRLYRGKGRWQGRSGPAAFGNELPWRGTAYCSIGASLYRATKERKYRDIVVATAKYILNPANGWVDPTDFYQIHMDGNGAFVHFLMDAYSIAPEELGDVPSKVEKMLEHVWTNHRRGASVTLHRESDHGIRNGWNPQGGEDGYRVGEVGTVHAQGEAARAFGVFAYFKYEGARVRSF